MLNAEEAKSEKPYKNLFDAALTKSFTNEPSKSIHVGVQINEDIVGALDAGWTPVRFNEKFDDDFPDWNEFEEAQDAISGAERHQAFYNWGRKDLSTGLEWTEIWGLDDLLFLFGFPDDDEKPIKSTYIRAFTED